MTCIEDVKAVFETARNSTDSVRLVVLDYLQTIYRSKLRELKAWEVSKEFGFFLQEYGRKVTIPMVVFVQLKPTSQSPDFSERICNDKTVYHHAVTAIEIKPNFDNGLTEFKLHKDRFGQNQGKSVFVQFVDGRYEPVSTEEIERLLAKYTSQEEEET
jgi:hypothetical protein